MIDPIVRQAGPSDGEQLLWLEDESRAALVGQRGGDRWLSDHPARGDAWDVALDELRVWVALIDEVLVGYLVASFEGDLVRIDDVYVTPGARELGFGDELLANAIAAARDRGARTLDGEALPGDRNTKNLYERAGIKARLITVSTPL